jgi:hypothetical protein
VDQQNCRIRNQHALIVKCRQCQIRVLYVPVRGSSGDTRKPTPLTKMPSGKGTDEVHPDPPATPVPKSKAKSKSKAKARARVRHEDGPNWEDFLIGTPPESAAEEPPTEEETTIATDGRLEWDGDPDTWEVYQANVVAWIASRRTPTRAPPHWDGNPDTWDIYQQETQEWVDTRREQMSLSTVSSRIRG